MKTTIRSILQEWKAIHIHSIHNITKQENNNIEKENIGLDDRKRKSLQTVEIYNKDDEIRNINLLQFLMKPIIISYLFVIDNSDSYIGVVEAPSC